MNRFLIFVLAGFVAQMIDGILGMAYGISATSLLLSMGIAPAAASASVHFAEVVASGFSAAAHVRLKNVVWSLAKRLMIPGAIGAAIGAYILTSVPGDAMKPYIAAYLLIMGTVIIVKALRKIEPREAHHRLGPLGFTGGFFDAIGGGGWGPIVVGTLLARGNEPRTTIGSVNFAEFFVTLAASLTFFVMLKDFDWSAIAGLALGGAIAAPIAALSVTRVRPRPLMIAVGILVILLSLRTIVRAI